MYALFGVVLGEEDAKVMHSQLGIAGGKRMGRHLSSPAMDDRDDAWGDRRPKLSTGVGGYPQEKASYPQVEGCSGAFPPARSLYVGVGE